MCSLYQLLVICSLYALLADGPEVVSRKFKTVSYLRTHRYFASPVTHAPSGSLQITREEMTSSSLVGCCCSLRRSKWYPAAHDTSATTILLRTVWYDTTSAFCMSDSTGSSGHRGPIAWYKKSHHRHWRTIDNFVQYSIRTPSVDRQNWMVVNKSWTSDYWRVMQQNRMVLKANPHIVWRSQPFLMRD